MSYGSAGEGRREESLEENVVALYNIVIYDMHEPAWFYLAWCCMSHHIVSSNDITVYAQHNIWFTLGFRFRRTVLLYK